MQIEKIEFDDILFALIMRKGAIVENVGFFSSADNSLQLGILEYKEGYVEKAHSHRRSPKLIEDVQETLHIESGKVEVNFYTNGGERIGAALLDAGDTILLINGGHAIRVLEDFRGIKVKQGPYRGIEQDKVMLEVKGNQ